MEKFTVLEEKHLPQIAELYKKAFGGEPWNDDWSDERQLAAYIEDIACSFNSLSFGLFDGDRPIAASIGAVRHWWEGTNYNIEELCVDPKLQGQGVGTRFLGIIEADVKKRGLCGIFLQTDSDKPACRFYKKNGFGELSEHVSFYKKV